MNPESRTPHRITLWIKMLSAVAGAGVVIAMGVLTVAVGGNEAHADDNGVAGTTITMGRPPSTPPTEFAAPELKVQAWKCGNIRKQMLIVYSTSGYAS